MFFCFLPKFGFLSCVHGHFLNLYVLRNRIPLVTYPETGEPKEKPCLCLILKPFGRVILSKGGCDTESWVDWLFILFVHSASTILNKYLSHPCVDQWED